MKLFKRIIALVVLSIGLFFLNTFLFSDMYAEASLYGSYWKKLARAESIDTEKVIIIGGSSSNLGFDSQLFEELSGKPAVNMAMAVAIPLRIYMQAAESCAKPGDSIIMALEHGYFYSNFDEVSEMYVDMVNIDPNLKCSDGFFGNIEFATNTFLRSFTRFNDCLVLAIRSQSSALRTIYIADSVNEYGDFCLHKDELPSYTSAPTNATFEYQEETFLEIKNYMNRMAEKGVTVYLSFAACDRNIYYNYEQYCADMQSTINTYIPAENVLGSPYDFAYDSDYFLDSAYHLQYQHRAEHTEKIYSFYREATN